MSRFIKRILLVIFIVLTSACATYPHHYTAYPAYGSYTVRQHYYGGAPIVRRYYSVPNRNYSYPPRPPVYNYWLHEHHHEEHHHGHEHEYRSRHH